MPRLPVIAQRNTTVSWLRVVPVHWEVSDDQESRSVPLAEREVDEEEALYGNERAPSTDTQVCYYNAPGPIRPDRIAIYMQ